MADEEVKISASEKKKEDWMNSKWRPMMGWMYMGVCTCDFVLFPVLWSVLQSLSHGQVTSQWQPLTLQGAGLFHLAMGAVIGVSAYGRTQEKLNGANNGGIQLPSNAGTTYVPPGQGSVNVSNQPGMGNSGFGGSNNNGFGPQSAAPSFGAAVGGMNNGGFNVQTSSPTAFGSPAAGGFGSSGGFGSPTPTGVNSNPGFGAPAVTTGFGGKPAPVQPPQPML
jgi:hypothetical protein